MLYICTYMSLSHFFGRMGCQEINRERKEERMRQKMTELHELPCTEMEKSGTIIESE